MLVGGEVWGVRERSMRLLVIALGTCSDLCQLFMRTSYDLCRFRGRNGSLALLLSPMHLQK